MVSKVNKLISHEELLEVNDSFIQEIYRIRMNKSDWKIIKKEGMKDYEAFDNMHRADGSFSKSERFSKL